MYGPYLLFFRKKLGVGAPLSMYGAVLEIRFIAR
jgi:hypothetical protein